MIVMEKNNLLERDIMQLMNQPFHVRCGAMLREAHQTGASFIDVCQKEMILKPPPKYQIDTPHLGVDNVKGWESCVNTAPWIRAKSLDKRDSYQIMLDSINKKKLTCVDGVWEYV